MHALNYFMHVSLLSHILISILSWKSYRESGIEIKEVRNMPQKQRLITRLTTPNLTIRSSFPPLSRSLKHPFPKTHDIPIPLTTSITFYPSTFVERSTNQAYLMYRSTRIKATLSFQNVVLMMMQL